MLINTKTSSDIERSPVDKRSQDLTGWTPIPSVDVSRWNDKLLTTDAHYRQYPYWCEPYRRSGKFMPRFYSYSTKLGEVAYVCILEGRVAGMKFGLIFRGPVALGNERLSNDTIRDLLNLAMEDGYAFLRFTHQSETVFEQLLSFENSRQVESLPFDRDPPKALIITQADTDAAMLGSFQTVARRNIRAAEKAGYVIRRSDSPEDYGNVWPMFERLAETKGFDLTNRKLDAWLDVIEAASEHGCSALYTASLDGVCVSAVHLLRYGPTAEFMLGALDLELLGKNPSPSALLHWTAMRDLYRSGCRYYNLGGPGDGVRNKVYQFKRKFRPEFRQTPPAITIVLNPLVYGCWDFAVLKGWLGLRRQVRRVLGKSKDIIQRTIKKSQIKM